MHQHTNCNCWSCQKKSTRACDHYYEPVYIVGGKNIRSFGQMQAFQHDVNDKFIKVLGGT